MKVIFNNYKKIGKKYVINRCFYIDNDAWYLEYYSGIRIHFTFCFMIMMFPILVIAKFDDTHDEEGWYAKSYHFLFFRYGRTFRSFGSVKECNAYIKWQRRHI